jgi:hypothetical protein
MKTATSRETAMTEKATQPKEPCDTEKHKEHLCHLQYEGYHYAHRAEYKSLVQDAQYLCRNCGRTAKSGANLCAPVQL